MTHTLSTSGKLKKQMDGLLQLNMYDKNGLPIKEDILPPNVFQTDFHIFFSKIQIYSLDSYEINI
jgi:hypothetical protein